jgi:hypothetical protein
MSRGRENLRPLSYKEHLLSVEQGKQLHPVKCAECGGVFELVQGIMTVGDAAPRMTLAARCTGCGLTTAVPE